MAASEPRHGLSREVPFRPGAEGVPAPGGSGEAAGVALHIYGTDLDRVGSSVRRFYDLPVRD
ncbi:hypothetical protein BKA00_006512 [Actinomadura coerulea]|uniref:Uncharacterized protein n=1 Tax=Actinomadura coerulea TaxID=46159 RepID=A0A7X0G572_9ACTN|nr:hypothetical protein [Actinomadura coerulea]MBB6399598.1 hypothetical protein [Actinomadura coerulea]GGQ12605.1 hypothetical protein GCM10010187_31030 [Actinomadura coerulea]